MKRKNNMRMRVMKELKNMEPFRQVEVRGEKIWIEEETNEFIIFGKYNYHDHEFASQLSKVMTLNENTIVVNGEFETSSFVKSLIKPTVHRDIEREGYIIYPKWNSTSIVGDNEDDVIKKTANVLMRLHTNGIFVGAVNKYRLPLFDDNVIFTVITVKHMECPLFMGKEEVVLDDSFINNVIRKYHMLIDKGVAERKLGIEKELIKLLIP